MEVSSVAPRHNALGSPIRGLKATATVNRSLRDRSKGDTEKTVCNSRRRAIDNFDRGVLQRAFQTSWKKSSTANGTIHKRRIKSPIRRPSNPGDWTNRRLSKLQARPAACLQSSETR